MYGIKSGDWDQFKINLTFFSTIRGGVFEPLTSNLLNNASSRLNYAHFVESTSFKA